MVAAPCAHLQLVRGPVRKGGVVRPLNSSVMRHRTPQEKKTLSYAKDRRNTFGENSKGSRKSIPRAKARSIRSERHVQDAALSVAARGPGDEESLVVAENNVRSTPPRTWKKVPDRPLGEYLKRRRNPGGKKNDA
jgi:hypothetical protein